MIRLLLHHSIDNYHSVISPYSNIACCIFATESACKRGSAEYSTCSRGHTIKYLRFRDVHHQMWRAKVFSRLERTHIPGRKNSKSRGGRNDERFGALVFVQNSGRDRDARSARSYTCIIPEATSSPARKESRESADRNRRCSNALRVPPPARWSSRRDKQGEGNRSALGLHPMVRYSSYHFI